MVFWFHHSPSPLFDYLLIYLFIIVWIHQFLYSWMIHYYHCLILELSQIWQMGSCWCWLLRISDMLPLRHIISYFLSQKDFSGSSCIFPAPALESAISLSSSGSFHWRMIYWPKWYKYLKIRCLMCSLILVCQCLTVFPVAVVVQLFSCGLCSNSCPLRRWPI